MEEHFGNMSIGFHSNNVSYDLGGALGHIYGNADVVIDNISYQACVQLQSKLVTDAHGVERYLPNP